MTILERIFGRPWCRNSGPSAANPRSTPGGHPDELTPQSFARPVRCKGSSWQSCLHQRRRFSTSRALRRTDHLSPMFSAEATRASQQQLKVARDAQRTPSQRRGGMQAVSRAQISRRPRPPEATALRRGTPLGGIVGERGVTGRRLSRLAEAPRGPDWAVGRSGVGWMRVSGGEMCGG